MTDKLIVRTSDRGTFKKCRQLWDFTSKIRLNYEPLRPADYFEFGTAWHRAMEVWYEADAEGIPPYQSVERETLAHKAFRDTTNEQHRALEELGFAGSSTDAEFEERLALGKGMLNYYFGWARIYDDFGPVTVEHEFEVSITDDSSTLVWCPLHNRTEWVNSESIWVNSESIVVGTENHQADSPFGPPLPVFYQGRLDGLVRDFAGKYWVLEHKTAERESATYWLQMDEQVGSYIWVLQHHLGIPIKGAIYTRAYKRVPEKPRILKSDGSVSCDKRQNTTAALFVQVVEEAHPFRPAFETISENEKYLNYHQFLTDPEVAPKFVERFNPTRNSSQIEDIGRRIAMEAQDMLNDPSIYPNVTPYNCNYCKFRGPCLTKQDGGDWEYHLASEFRERNS